MLINGEVIEDSVLDQERARLRDHYAADGRVKSMEVGRREQWLRELARQQVIARALLQQEAWKDAGRNTGCESRVSAREGQIRLSRLLERITADVRRPSEHEVELYYQTHRLEFDAPERIHCRHIVKNVPETDPEAALACIREAAAELQRGVSFSEVANRYSDCGAKGGELGWFPSGVMVEEFDNVVFSLKQGETSPVFETPFGFHIVLVVDRRPGGVRPFAEVREALAAELYNRRRQQAISAFVKGLWARAEIQPMAGANEKAS